MQGAGFAAISFGEQLLAHPDEARFWGDRAAQLGLRQRGYAGRRFSYYYGLLLLVYHFMALSGPTDRIHALYRVEDTRYGWATQFKEVAHPQFATSLIIYWHDSHFQLTNGKLRGFQRTLCPEVPVNGHDGRDPRYDVSNPVCPTLAHHYTTQCIERPTA